MGLKCCESEKPRKRGGFQGDTPGSLLVFARCVVLRSHHTDGPLPLYGAAVVVKVVVVVGRRRGHRKHAGHVELHVWKSRGGGEIYRNQKHSRKTCTRVLQEKGQGLHFLCRITEQIENTHKKKMTFVFFF